MFGTYVRVKVVKGRPEGKRGGGPDPSPTRSMVRLLLPGVFDPPLSDLDRYLKPDFYSRPSQTSRGEGDGVSVPRVQPHTGSPTDPRWVDGRIENSREKSSRKPKPRQWDTGYYRNHDLIY